jgi:signal transduction histidine kinase
MSFKSSPTHARQGEPWPRLIRTLATHRGRSLDRAICRDIGSGFDFDRVMLLIVDDEQRMLIPRAAWRPGLPGSVRTALATLLRTPLDPGRDGTLPVTAACAVRQQQIFVPDATNPRLDPGIAQRAAIVRVLGTTGYVATPVMHAGRSLGVLVVDRVGRPIHETDRAILRDIAALLGVHMAARVAADPFETRPERYSDIGDVLDALDDGVLLIEHDGTICYSNPAAARELGIEPQDLIGQSLEEVLRCGAAVELRTVPSSPVGALSPRVPPRGDLERMADAGPGGVPLADGRRAFVLPRRHRLAHGLDDGALRMLVHDLKAPMQSVIGFAELLQLGRAGSLQDDQNVFVGHILRNGETLLALIDRILETHPSERAQSDPPLIDVRDILERVGVCMAGKAFRANVTIDVDVCPDAPLVAIDRLEFYEVVQNLVDNAIQAAPAGAHVLLRAMPCGASLCIEVVPAEADRAGVRHAQPFELLRQSTEFDRRRRAPHLGLRIVREIVERNNGEVWAEPAANGGLAFKFILPADPAGPSVECA